MLHAYDHPILFLLWWLFYPVCRSHTLPVCAYHTHSLCPDHTHLAFMFTTFCTWSPFITSTLSHCTLFDHMVYFVMDDPIIDALDHLVYCTFWSSCALYIQSSCVLCISWSCTLCIWWSYKVHTRSFCTLEILIILRSVHMIHTTGQFWYPLILKGLSLILQNSLHPTPLFSFLFLFFSENSELPESFLFWSFSSLLVVHLIGRWFPCPRIISLPGSNQGQWLTSCKLVWTFVECPDTYRLCILPSLHWLAQMALWKQRIAMTMCKYSTINCPRDHIRRHLQYQHK